MNLAVFVVFFFWLAVIWLLYWLVAYKIMPAIPIEPPFGKWISIIFLVIAVVGTIALIGSLLGINTGLNFPGIAR